MTMLEFLMAILGINETDVIRAVLTNYCPCQTGALVGSWRQRKNYGAPPTSRELRSILEKADFRCQKCGGTYRLSFDHKNDDRSDSTVGNLEVLCYPCNRSKHKPATKRDQSLAFLQMLKSREDARENLPIYDDFCRAMGFSNGGSGRDKAAFLTHRYQQWKAKHSL